VFILEYGNLKNEYLEGLLILKMGEMGIWKQSDGYLENNLENWYLENVLGTDQVTINWIKSGL